MKLTGKQEWIAIAALIVYIAFTPGIPLVRDFLSGSVGKAVGLGVIMWVWKTVSKPVALLLLVSFLRCGGMREGMENPTDVMHCPAPFTLAADKTCKDSKGNPGPAPSVCMGGQKWDGSKCASPTETSTAPPMTTPSPPPPPPAVMDMPKEGFQPNQKADKYAPA
jgi:hypothetical protein